MKSHHIKKYPFLCIATFQKIGVPSQQKMMKLKFIYATLALLLLFSCSVEDNLESSMQDNNEIVTYKVAQEEAQNIVQGFIDDWSYNGVGASSDLHWSQIISDCENNNGVLSSSYTPQSLNEVAHLCRYLGIAFGAKYNRDGSTSVGEDKPIDWFNKWGGLKASKLKEYNESQIITSIKNGNPVYGRGNSGRKKFLGITVKYKGGHAWVYDGYISATKNGKQQNLIHCNWGWGPYKFYNGYYLSKVFDTNSGPEIYDNEVTRSGQPHYYKYNLEYSVISR